ncbi:MAG: RES domain-containing protein [Myxococcota bacterium]
MSSREVSSREVRAWRFCDRRWAPTPLSGEGARRYGGRWNGRGTAIAYTAESRALAILEVLAHTTAQDAPTTHVAIEVTIPGALVVTLDAATLPSNWRAYPAPPALARFGDEWVREGASAVLGVPSSLVPAERNYLINPHHPDAGAIVTGPPEPVVYDPRLFGTA